LDPICQQLHLAIDPRDPDIVHAHRIARRSSRPGSRHARWISAGGRGTKVLA
jgi:hypothetical protein